MSFRVKIWELIHVWQTFRTSPPASPDQACVVGRLRLFNGAVWHVCTHVSDLPQTVVNRLFMRARCCEKLFSFFNFHTIWRGRHGGGGEGLVKKKKTTKKEGSDARRCGAGCENPLERFGMCTFFGRGSEHGDPVDYLHEPWNMTHNGVVTALFILSSVVLYALEILLGWLCASLVRQIIKNVVTFNIFTIFIYLNHRNLDSLPQGVLQGSVLGPLLFNLYLPPIGDIIHPQGRKLSSLKCIGYHHQ